MAMAPEVVSAELAKEAEYRTSSTEVSKTKYSLDGVEEGEGDNDIYSQANPPRPGFTKYDQKDMYRMGKIQELRRSYRPLSALSFAVVLTAVWEFLLM